MTSTSPVPQARDYLEHHARPLDLALYDWFFEGGDAPAVATELAAYRNDDGGFGRALEPDHRLPASSVLATTIALQYLDCLPRDVGGELRDSAIGYLLDSYDDSRGGWLMMPPEVDDHPHAPWLDYAAIQEWPGWGNPSAEILGYLCAHADRVGDEMLASLTERAVERLKEITEPEQHEIKCFLRLYGHADPTLAARLHDRLGDLVEAATVTNSAAWTGYVATPLTFVPTPESPFADRFSASLLRENLEFVRRTIVDGTHWEPNWEWGQFEDEWQRSRTDWIGKLTVEQLRVLQAFEHPMEP